MTFASPDDVIRRFDEQNYLLDTGTASAIYLAVTLGRPLLLEGEPGVGKTTAAKTLAVVLDTTLIRLQCYEGLTANEALYDWNYQRQLLSIRLAEARGKGISDISEADLYTEAYLVDRPILRCVRHRGPTPPVLLIDEIDRADDEFEALLLEFLGESAVTVPELGTFLAECPPIAVLTSNRSRDLHDALRRRCLYHWIDYPGAGPGGRDRAPHGARGYRAVDRERHSIRLHCTGSRSGQATRCGRDYRLGGGFGGTRGRRPHRSGFESRSGQPWGPGQNARRPYADSRCVPSFY